MTYKNKARLILVASQLAISFVAGEELYYAAIWVFIVLIGLELTVVAFKPMINVKHNVHRILRAPVGAKIAVVPWTRSRLGFYQMAYGRELGNNPKVKLTLGFDNTITLERVAV